MTDAAPRTWPMTDDEIVVVSRVCAMLTASARPRLWEWLFGRWSARRRERLLREADAMLDRARESRGITDILVDADTVRGLWVERKEAEHAVP